MTQISIENVSRLRLNKVENSKQALREGQIIQGKILKIYPNNKAQIQLGSKIMIAQLEASLAIGEKYHFKVQAMDEIIHLRVIGEQLKGQPRINATELMQQLGIKVNKQNISFVQMLINEEVPFESADIRNANQLISSVKNKAQAEHILKEMIVQRLPITNSIFQALFIKKTSELSDNMSAVLRQLRMDSISNPTQTQQDLISRLSQMLEGAPTTKQIFVTQIIEEIMNNNQQLFNILKATGVVSQQLDFLTWKSAWHTYTTENTNTPSVIAPNQLSVGNTPYPLNMEVIENILQQLQSNRATQPDLHNIVQKWANEINKIIIQNRALSEQSFAQFKQEINSRLTPLLPTVQQRELSEIIQNNPTHLRQLLTTIQTLANEQTFVKVDQILTSISQQIPPIKGEFLSLVGQTNQYLGLADENMLVDIGAQRETSTIKSMLIQMVQHSGGGINEHAQQLLHFINGLQLQSINETSNFIQASIQIPGEKLHLNSDLYMDFESKKTKEGQIDPDYCRILFYLDLENLRETIVDMQIQKRLVSVTIFNDQENIREKSIQLQPMLSEGLDKLDYQLSNITVKNLHEMKRSANDSSSSERQKNSYEGIDFRI